MRKNWTQTQDAVLAKIVAQVGVSDWTTISNQLKHRHVQIQRTGKQCRERWYNHLDPTVNKEDWSYSEELRLFQLHKQLGNRWKDISFRLRGRTDNNIKNHFYSTLRRSLRRLNKVLGQKNPTLQMRQIKPSVLTTILNFIYDHQEQRSQNNTFLKDLQDLPKLIFEFAAFKPVKKSMRSSITQQNRSKINTIFRLIETFKDTYSKQKDQKNKQQKAESWIQQQASPLSHQIITSQFKSLQKFVNIIINSRKQQVPSINNQNKLQLGQKEQCLACITQKNFILERGNFNGLTKIEQAQSLAYHHQEKIFSDLVVIGKHWSPPTKEQQTQEPSKDQILQMNYD